MAYSVNDIKSMNSDTLQKAIYYCKNKAVELRKPGPNGGNREATAQKFDAAATAFENAEKKLKAVILVLKNTVPTGATVSYWDELFAGKENVVTLEYIGSKMMTDKSVNISTLAGLDGTKATFGSDEAEVNMGDDSDMTPASVRRSIFDIGKDFISDIGGKDGKSKGRAVGLARGLLGVGIAEVATRGVTGLLAKAGIMGEGMGLFGLLKTGITNLPMAWPHIVSAATAIWNFSPLGVCALGGLLAVKAIPVIRKKAQQLFKHVKGMDTEKAMEDNFKALISGQPDPTV